MILPAAGLVWTAVHEAGHAVVAMASGVKVHRVTVVPAADGSNNGHCSTADETFPDSRRLLCYQLAGLMAVKHCWPDHAELALLTGLGDQEEAARFVVGRWGRDHLEAVMNYGLDSTERLVGEFWPEISALATRLLAEGTVEHPSF